MAQKTLKRLVRPESTRAWTDITASTHVITRSLATSSARFCTTGFAADRRRSVLPAFTIACQEYVIQSPVHTDLKA